MAPRWMVLLVALCGCGPAVGWLHGPDPDTAAPDTAVGDSGPVDSVPGADDPSGDVLFDEDVIPRFTLVVETADADRLAEEEKGGPHEYVPATLVWEGRSYGPIGIRIKGENSFLPFRQKPSLKLDFNRYAPGGRFLGFQGLTLNNMSNDYSMMHERVAYRVYREAGVPAYRAHHAWLTVVEVSEGEVVSESEYGLYTLLEDADPDLLARWFPDPEGTLFEIWDVDFYDGYIPCPNLYGTDGCFQLEGGEEDRTALQAVADAMELGPSAAVEAADPWLDYASFLRYWAVGMVIAQFDAYPYSSPGDDAHVYLDPAEARLKFMPHGADETFYYNEYSIYWANGVLGAVCLEVPECAAQVKALAWEVQALTETMDLAGTVERIREQVAPLVTADTHKPYTQVYVDYYQQHMANFVAERRARLESFLGPPPGRSPRGARAPEGDDPGN